MLRSQLMLLTSYTREELKKKFAELGLKSYRGEQVFLWIYKKMDFNPDNWTDINMDLRGDIKKNHIIFNIKLIKKYKSTDKNTLKFLFELSDKEYIESVIIFDSNRITLCTSTQIGCNLNCEFCATGKLDFKRNLSVDEIISQFLIVQDNMKEKITNVVFMGMGEPFLNYDNTIKAAKVFADQKGLSIAHRKITISTAGIIPSIKRFIEEKHKFRLAISLNSAFEESRSFLMPVNKKYNLKELKKSLKNYYNISKKELTFEYVLIENINDFREDAEALYEFTKNIKCKINLIPYNPVDKKFKAPSDKKLIEFYYFLREKGLTVNIRDSHGSDINAACGQLSAGYLDKKTI